MTLSEKAKEYAIQMHQRVNHYYDGHPYSFHLEMVVGYAEKYVQLIPKPDREIVIASCWCHDLIEDCRQSYNDIKKELGEEVAEIVYALTNQKGKTRKERANADYYRGILNTPYADFVKICDRLANIKYSSDAKSKMLDVYRKEQGEFEMWLYHVKYDVMFKEINRFL